MSFGSIVFTNKGRVLHSKAQTGIQLNFTRLAVGDGQLSGQAIADLNSLVNEKKSISINKLKTLSGGKAVVGGVLSNEELINGFYWRELGLFATDPDLGEILYCYGNAGDLAEYIPSPGGSEILEKEINLITIIGNASNLNANIDQSLTYATKEDLENISIPVTSVNTKTGDILLKANDIDIIDTANNFTTSTIEGALSELFQSVTDGKDNLYSALVAKGITPMSRDFQDLYNAIMTNDFVRTNDANAVAGDIRTGKTAYIGGSKVTGNIPVKGNNPQAGYEPQIGVSTSGGLVYLKAPKGIYDQDTWIKYSDNANVKAENIKSGVNILGVIGTAGVVKSTQRGIYNITGDDATYNVPISTVDPTKSIVITQFTVESTYNNNQDALVATCSALTSSYLTLMRYRGQTDYDIEVKWQVIEFENASVQRGVVDVAEHVRSVNVSVNNPGSNYLVNLGTLPGATSNSYINSYKFIGNVNSTTLTIKRNDAGYQPYPARVAWQLISF